MKTIEPNQNKLLIGNLEILPNFSILRVAARGSLELRINEKLKLWVYENKSTQMPKKVTIKQIRFLSNLLSFFINYQKDSSNYKFAAMRSYVPTEIAEKIIENPTLGNKILTPSPLYSLSNFINTFTLNFSEVFTLSFFSLFATTTSYSTNEFETYVKHYKEINREILKIFKILARKDIVFMTNNILGDFLIYPQIPRKKTTRHTKVSKGDSYIIPLDKVNIVDLAGIHYLSSSFKIMENVAIGKLSKKKLATHLTTSKEFKTLLKRLNLSTKPTTLG